MLIVGASFPTAGVEPRTATLVALLLAQIGEFSFVLINAEFGGGIIDRNQYGLVVAVALGSILLSPPMVRLGPALVPLTARLPGSRGAKPRWRPRLSTFPISGGMS